MHYRMDGLEDGIGSFGGRFVDISNLPAIHVDIINQSSLI